MVNKKIHQADLSPQTPVAQDTRVNHIATIALKRVFTWMQPVEQIQTTRLPLCKPKEKTTLLCTSCWLLLYPSMLFPKWRLWVAVSPEEAEKQPNLKSKDFRKIPLNCNERMTQRAVIYLTILSVSSNP